MLAAIGYLGKICEQSLSAYGKAHHVPLPNIEYVLWAILIGLAVSNTIGIPAVFQPGVATYEFWLKTGIVLLGSRFLLGDVLRLGGLSLTLVVLELAVAFSLMTLLGRWFGLKPKLTSLLAVGSAVCGVSAIIATKGAIDADDEDSSYAIAAILALGAIALFTFPLIGHWLHLGDRAFGLWAGLAVDNTAEATAAMIGFVVLGYALYWARKGQAREVEGKASFLWRKFPKFVLGFLLISALATAGIFNKAQIGSLGNLSRWAFLLTFAGVGLRTNFRELKLQGLRPFAVGAIGEAVIAVVTLGMVLVASKLFHL